MKNIYFGGLLAAGLTLLAGTAQAQTDFHPGYLVRPAGDTVRGLVDYRGARRNSLVCQFRPTATAPIEVVLPQAAHAYGIWGEADYRAVPTPQPDSAGRPRAPRLFFLEVVVGGAPAALYQQHTSGNNTRFYVQKDSAASLRELRVERRTAKTGDLQYYQDVPVFRGVLNEEFADCPSLLLSLAKTELTATSLEAAVRGYNTCRLPGGAVAPARRQQSSLVLEVLLGAQASSLTFSGYLSPSSGNFTSGLLPEGGLGISLSSPRLRNKLAWRLEVLYGQQRYEDQYSFTPSGSGNGATQYYPYTYQTRLQTDYLRVPLLVRYAPLPGRLQPFVEAGPTAGALLSLTQESRYHDTRSATYGTWAPAYDPANLRKLEFGLLGGVGLQLTGLAGHAAAVLGRVEVGNGFLSTEANYNSSLRYHLLLSFGLTRQR